MKKLEVRNPATGKVIGTYESDTAETINQKLNDLRKSSWRHTAYEYRASKIEAFAKLLTDNRERAAKLLTEEVGKPIAQARGEIDGTLGRLDYFLNAGQTVFADEVVYSDDEQGLEERISYDPIGVIANISAWNYPYFVGGNVIFPALLAGNSVLYKPSEICVGTGLFIVELLQRAGVPADALAPVIGDGAVGELLTDAGIDGLFFTGSLATGRAIAMKLGPKMIPLQLELGGKDPAYVCEDADVNKAASALAEGAFYNAGQSCCSVERIYVHRKLYGEFTEALVREVEAFVVGNPLEEKTFLGPLARSEQIKVLEAQVQDAITKGAKLKTGGKAHNLPGFFPPTVLVDCTNDMLVMREESFGPVIGVAAVDDDEAAIAQMNDTKFGLTAAVFTPSQDRAHRILSQLDSGSAYWNCSDRVSPRLPWTGRKGSGMGYTLSHLGMRAFTKARGWHLRGQI